MHLKPRVYFLLATTLFISATLVGQNLAIEGNIQSNTGEAVPFAAVGLMSFQDSSLIKVATSQENGNFSISNLSKGEYFLKITSVGYQEYFSNKLILSNKPLKLETLTLQANVQELEGVEVVAQKQLVEVLADKTVFNVQGTINSTGSTGFELLRKAPGVMIDNNDNLILEGKSGVQIYIDGKPSILSGENLTNYLKTLQADDIEAIELITQPSSKYDAAGTAGIINIKLKKDKSLGTNGSIAIGAGQGKNSRYNTSISLNSRAKKLNVFGTYSHNNGKYFKYINLIRTQSNTIFEARSQGLNTRQNHNTKLGLDFFASPKSTFGLMFNGNFSDAIENRNSRTPIIPLESNVPTQVLIAKSEVDENSQNISVNANYQFADTLGHSFNIDLDYAAYSNSRVNFQPNFNYNGLETELLNEQISELITPTDISIFSFKMDYEQNLGKGKLAVGIKSSWINTDNTLDFYNIYSEVRDLDRTQSNNFVYDENVNAGYLNYSYQKDKISFQFGVRAEQTISEGQLNSFQVNANENVKRSYLDFFPSGGFSYKVNANHGLSFNYSRRISRPNYYSLNPFLYQTDALSFRQGNAFLQPQYTNNLKISHAFKNSLNTSISYSYVRDFFAQVTQAEGEQRSVIMERNIANQRVLNFNMTYPLNVAKWWSSYFSLNAYRSSFTDNDESFVALTQNTMSLYVQNTFSLPAGFKFELSGWYRTPSVWGGTYEVRSQGFMDLGLQKSFLNNKLSTRIALSDVFQTLPWRGDTQYGDVIIRGNGGWESRVLRVNLSYKFGNQKVKSSRKRKTGIEDESNRT